MLENLVVSGGIVMDVQGIRIWMRDVDTGRELLVLVQTMWRYL